MPQSDGNCVASFGPLPRDHAAAVSTAPFPRLGTSLLQKKPQQHHSVLTVLMYEVCKALSDPNPVIFAPDWLPVSR